MRRQKTREHSYQYVCPNCGHVIKSNKEKLYEDEQER